MKSQNQEGPHGREERPIIIGMLRTTRQDDVIRFDLCRPFAGRGWYWTSAFLVDGLLIDSGPAHASCELVRVVGDMTLDRIVNTHSHEDHIGGNGPIQRSREALEILAHPSAIPVLEDPRGAQPLHPYRWLFWGWPEPSAGRPLQDQEVVETRNHRFQVIFTPGHSPDHLCLYEPNRGWLFTGDLFVGGRDRSLRADADIWGSIRSLRRLAALPSTRLFPGSARTRDDSKRELVGKADYLEDLGEKVLDLHRRGWGARAIVRALCGGPMWVEILTLGHFSRRHLVLSYLRGEPTRGGDFS